MVRAAKSKRLEVITGYAGQFVRQSGFRLLASKHGVSRDIMKMGSGTTFGERVYILLQNKGVTQSRMARDLRISASTVSKYMMGRCNPKREHVESIAEYLGSSYGDLIGDSETAEDARAKKSKNKKRAGLKNKESEEVTEDA